MTIMDSFLGLFQADPVPTVEKKVDSGSSMRKIVRKKKSASSFSSDPLTTSQATTSLYPVGPDVDYNLLYSAYLRVPRLRACVNVIVRDTVKPWGRLVPVDPKGKVTMKDQKTWANFCKMVNPQQSMSELLSRFMEDLEVYDDAYLEKVYNGRGDLVELWNIDPRTMFIDADPHGGIRKYVQVVNTTRVDFSPDEIIHKTKYHSGTRKYGLSPLLSVWDDIGIYIYAMNYNGDFFEHNATPRGILLFPTVPDKNWAEFKKERSLMEKSNQKQQIMEIRGIKDGRAEFIKMSGDNIDMQFIEMIKILESHFQLVYGVPDVKLGITASGKLSNPEMQLIVHYDNVETSQTIGESLINNGILPELGINSGLWLFNSPREEDEQRATVIAKLKLDMKGITINEWRATQNLPPVSWGDEPQLGGGSPQQQTSDPQNPDAPDNAQDATDEAVADEEENGETADSDSK